MIETQCSQCGKSVLRWPSELKEAKNSFCSKGCRSEFISKNPCKKKTGYDVQCRICSGFFYVQKSRVDAKFCSKNCKSESQKGNIPWNKGLTKHDDERIMSVSNKAREQLKREYVDGTRDKHTIALAANETLRARTRKRLVDGVSNTKIDKRGYRKIYLPERGWVLEHRYIWEKQNGRRIPTGFHIHHKNGDSLDNRIENLELISASEHSKLHARERRLKK